MPHRTRPMTALLLFTGLNAVLVSTISPVYDFVCFLPYWERRARATSVVLIAYTTLIFLIQFCEREHRRQEREAALDAKSSGSI